MKILFIESGGFKLSQGFGPAYYRTEPVITREIVVNPLSWNLAGRRDGVILVGVEKIDIITPFRIVYIEPFPC